MQNGPEEIEMPEGIELRDFGDYKSARSDIFNRAKDAFVNSYPMSWGGVRAEVEDVEYEGPEEVSLAEQKKAVLEDKYVSRRLRGTMKLYDEETGKLLDKNKLSFMRVPYLTNRGTFIHGGNEYTTIMQSRLLPGVYTRRQANGALETQFNLRQARSAFRIGLEPENPQFRLKIGQANMHMYSLLKDLGVPDESLKKMWGDEVFALNAAKYDARVFEKAYERLVPAYKRKVEVSREEKVAAIREALDEAEVNAGVMRKNLPNKYDMKKSAEWQARWAGREAMIEKIASRAACGEFKPDLDPSECFAAFTDRCIFKCAGEEWEEIKQNGPDKDFNPDLKPNELKEQYSNLYGRMGSRLAGMDKWPSSWIPPGSNELGWLDWYFGYADGKRTEDDKRQIARWKSFKSRTLTQFLQNPTPRRAFSLKNWAIDPMLYLEEKDQAQLRSRMDKYRTDKLNKVARVDEHSNTLKDLLEARTHSDEGRYAHKNFIVQRSMMERPEEWVVDTPGGPHPGVTHVPTGFRLHIQKSVIPPEVITDPTYALSEPEITEDVTQIAKEAAFDVGELQALAQYLNTEANAGLPLNVAAPTLEQAILDFIAGESTGNSAILESAIAGADKYREQYQDMSTKGIDVPQPPPSVWDTVTKSSSYYHGSPLDEIDDNMLRSGSWVSDDPDIAHLMGRYHEDTGETWTDEDMEEPYMFGNPDEIEWKDGREPSGEPTLYELQLSGDQLDMKDNPYEHTIVGDQPVNKYSPIEPETFENMHAAQAAKLESLRNRLR